MNKRVQSLKVKPILFMFMEWMVAIKYHNPTGEIWKLLNWKIKYISGKANIATTMVS